MSLQLWSGCASGRTEGQRIFRALAIGVTCGIAAACLWPFGAPKNEVSWLENRNGLKFGLHATVMSSLPLEVADSDGDGWSVELWMQASKTDSQRHILSVYSPGNTNTLSLRQYNDGVVLSTQDKREEDVPTDKSIYAGSVFRPETPVFLSITANGRATSLFVDGRLRKSSELLRLSRRAISGQVILADSTRESDSWPGRISGLAVYGSELTPTEVSRHFEAWRAHKAPETKEEERAVAMYLFNEGGGRIVHNFVPLGTDLTIPERYAVAGKPFLESPLQEYDRLGSHSRSILINVIGFIPFGYAWYGYLSLSLPRRKSMMAVATIILGGALSFSVEVLQAFLPTRTSGVADIITNTAGTALGIAAYRLGERMVDRVLSRTDDAVAGAHLGQ